MDFHLKSIFKWKAMLWSTLSESSSHLCCSHTVYCAFMSESSIRHIYYFWNTTIELQMLSQSGLSTKEHELIDVLLRRFGYVLEILRAQLSHMTMKVMWPAHCEEQTRVNWIDCRAGRVEGGVLSHNWVKLPNQLELHQVESTTLNFSILFI